MERLEQWVSGPTHCITRKIWGKQRIMGKRQASHGRKSIFHSNQYNVTGGIPALFTGLLVRRKQIGFPQPLSIVRLRRENKNLQSKLAVVGNFPSGLAFGIVGPNSSTYTITNIQSSHAGTCKLTVSNSHGSVTSNTTTIAVNP